MNTIKSVWVGWGSLCIAGGGAYYFAKKSINADKIARFEAEQKRKRLQNYYEHSSTESDNLTKNTSQKISSDSTLTTIDSKSDGEGDVEKSKYEPVRPFRSLKGDRFS